MTNYSRSVIFSNGPHCSKNFPVKFGFSPKTIPANIAQKLPSRRCSKPLLIPFFNFSHKRPTFAFTGIHTRLSEKDRTQGLTRRNRGRFGWGWYHYSRSVPHVHQHPRAGYQNGKFCRFWGLAVGAPKERRKPSEQRCAYACRCSEGVAAPLGCVIFLQFGDVALFSLCAQHFLNVQGWGGITTLGVLCVLLKHWTAACQNGSFAVF